MPLRVIFRRASVTSGHPCARVELPANRSARPTIVSSVDHAAELIDALETERNRALWATAFYAGLRRGELMALRWRNVDLAAGVLHIESSYDPSAPVRRPEVTRERASCPDSRPPARTPSSACLASRRADPDALVFGDDAETPFDYHDVLGSAYATWAKAELDRVGLHTARHTCASVMIAAGVNIKALSEFLGHASITISLDRYGHLLPGSINEATTLLDTFLDRTNGRTNGRNEEALHIGAF